MDPLGFSLENYDVLGRWREQRDGMEIDASAKLPTGEVIHGVEGLQSKLMDRKLEFINHLARKMLGYALGRSLHDADSCVVEQLSQQVVSNEYRIEALIVGIVLSRPFRYVDPVE